MREHYNISWGKLRFSDKARMYNKFCFITIIGNVFQIIGSFLYFLRPVREL